MKRILMLLVVVLMLFFTNLKAQVVPNPIKIKQAKQKVGQVVTVFGVVNSANFKISRVRILFSR
jgi:rRNA processing protein Gar1